MLDRPLYLKPNVQVEALFNQWYSVAFNIPPASAAMFIANSHLKIMRSYLLSPEMHAAAAEDPALMGGPFINYPENRAEEVRALMEKTLKEQRRMIEFAEAVRALDKLLQDEAKGYSLEPLYPRVPEILKSYVELTYDLNSNPSIRFIEGLLYNSPFYDPTLQSFGLSLIEEDNRPFVLSTPRLSSSNYLILNNHFGQEGVDEMFRMREAPRPFGEIKELLGFDDESNDLFSTFLTEHARSSPVDRYEGEGVRVRYFGHACLLLETDEVSVLTDPLISYKYDTNIPRYTYADLPRTLDYIIITHGHLDHLVLESLLQLRYKTKNVIVPRSGGNNLADPSLRLLLKNIGFKNVFEIDEFDDLDIPGGIISSLPFMGEHHDLNIQARTAYLIRMKERSICVAADSCNLEPMLYENIRKLYGSVDVLFLGMECDGAPLTWFYGPLLTSPLPREMDYSRRGSASDRARAMEIVKRLHCKQVFVYAMGLEPWLSYILSINPNDKESLRITESANFITECKEGGVTAEMVFAQKEIIL
jgi:L-ascorbate metabolism protein UlaG (beta-lactamase superfamily)